MLTSSLIAFNGLPDSIAYRDLGTFSQLIVCSIPVDMRIQDLGKAMGVALSGASSSSVPVSLPGIFLWPLTSVQLPSCKGRPDTFPPLLPVSLCRATLRSCDRSEHQKLFIRRDFPPRLPRPTQIPFSTGICLRSLFHRWQSCVCLCGSMPSTALPISEGRCREIELACRCVLPIPGPLGGQWLWPNE